MADTVGKDFDLDRWRIELEEQKIQIELEKIKVERFKAQWTGGSVVVSLLIAAFTISFSAWSQYKQSKTQFEIQNQQARSQFQIKAAEIVMNAELPTTTQHKAIALSALFPDMLPANFATSFKPELYSSTLSYPPGSYTPISGPIMDRRRGVNSTQPIKKNR